MLSFENENYRLFFSRYYTSTVEIKDFNVLINGKSFFDIPIKKFKKSIQKIAEMNDCNNLLDYDYFSNHAIDSETKDKFKKRKSNKVDNIFN